MSTTFWMFPEGVAKLTAQLDRAREDAAQAKAHVTRHCALSLGQVGLLPDTFGATGVHKKAVALVERTLGNLAARIEYVVEGVRASVDDYQTADDESSRVFGALEALLPPSGSLPPSYLRYGLTFPGISFSDLAEPTAVLRDPGTGEKEPWSFDPVSLDWVNPTSYVRTFIQEVTGRDPFQQVTLALSGDWMLFQRVGFVWVQIGTFCEQLGKNLARAAYDLRDVWKGREAEAAERYILALANATTDFAQLCRQLVARYSNAATAAEEFNEFAAGLLADVVANALLGIATKVASAATPPAMRVAANTALALLAARIVLQLKWLNDKYEIYQNALGLAATWVNNTEFTGLDPLIAERSLR
ncbi:hypothetical protein [Lentzea sp. NPDC051838]|uniref:hypothetical protein n=1 Tax=Lentzea sp. NPDC051838 TaxID=3154849 RepID=UPI0034423AE9